MPSDLLIWTAGSQPSSFVASLDAQKDSKGRVEVDRRLQLIEAESEADSSSKIALPATAGVYCVGDVAAVRGLDLPCNAQVLVLPMFKKRYEIKLYVHTVSRSDQRIVGYTSIYCNSVVIASPYRPVPRWLCSSRITLLTIYGQRKNDADRLILGTDFCIMCTTFYCFLV